MGVNLKRLKAYKVLNGISNQKEMADMLNISITTYCQKEKGKTDFTASEVNIMAKKFGIPTDELLVSDVPVLK